MKIYSIEDHREAIIVTDDESGQQNIVCGEEVLLEDVAKLTPEQLMERGFCPYESEETEEKTVKGEVIYDDNSVFLTFYTPQEYKEIKALRKNALEMVYENKINKVIRKATQDLAFGDIPEIPQSIIDKRKELKAEYHQKRKAIAEAENVPALNLIRF